MNIAAKVAVLEKAVQKLEDEVATLRGLALDDQATLEGIDLIKVGPQQIQAIKTQQLSTVG